MMKIEGSGSASGSGSIIQRHGSADPDPHQNVMDPEHCFFLNETEFLQDKVYTGQSTVPMYGDKVNMGTKFIRDKVYTGQSSYGDKVYMGTKFFLLSLIKNFFIRDKF
jgi:hypothetical protein